VRSSIFAVEGSAAVEFVLILVPTFLVFNLLVLIAFGSMSRSLTVAAGAQLAQDCALADFDPSLIASDAERFLPTWLYVDDASCVRNSDFAEVELGTSLRLPARVFESRVRWHAASEASE
jgi:hypothetical protein